MTWVRKIITYVLHKNSPILLALVALLICIWLQPQALSRSTYNLQVTFDISQSMNVEDMVVGDKIVSRLTAAKLAARNLLQQLPCGSQIGWSIFTHRRVLSLTTPIEVCQHYAGLLSSLELINGRMRWAEASGIGKGLYQSIRASHDIGDSTRIIFITDGHEAPPLRSGSRGMPKTDKFDVAGLIVGVGDKVPVRIPKLDNDGHVIGYWQADEVVQRRDDTSAPSHEELSNRQDAHLSKLARLAKLTYLPLESVEQLAENVLLKSTSHEMSHKKIIPTDLRWIPALLALLLLCWRFFPGMGKF